MDKVHDRWGGAEKDAGKTQVFIVGKLGRRIWEGESGKVK